MLLVVQFVWEEGQKMCIWSQRSLNYILVRLYLQFGLLNLLWIETLGFRGFLCISLNQNEPTKLFSCRKKWAFITYLLSSVKKFKLIRNYNRKLNTNHKWINTIKCLYLYCTICEDHLSQWLLSLIAEMSVKQCCKYWLI